MENLLLLTGIVTALSMEHQLIDDELQFLGKKKKRVKTKDRFQDPATPAVSSTYQSVPSVTDEEDYDYMFLLKRIKIENGPNLKGTLPQPHISVHGRRTHWTNFYEFHNSCNRTPCHVIEYIQNELCTGCHTTGSNILVIKQRMNVGSIQQLCRAYVNRYVLCEDCKRLDTLLVRDAKSRLTFVQCQQCHSCRSVQQTKKPFVAVLKRQQEKEVPD